jgi:hypothetical protein
MDKQYPGDLAKPRISFIRLPEGYPLAWWRCSSVPAGWVVSGGNHGAGRTPELAYMDWLRKSNGVRGRRASAFSDVFVEATS